MQQNEIGNYLFDFRLQVCFIDIMKVGVFGESNIRVIVSGLLVFCKGKSRRIKNIAVIGSYV